jgi:hypothetical protein
VGRRAVAHRADNLVQIDPHSATVVGRLAVPEGSTTSRADGAVWVSAAAHRPSSR